MVWNCPRDGKAVLAYKLLGVIDQQIYVAIQIDRDNHHPAKIADTIIMDP